MPAYPVGNGDLATTTIQSWTYDTTNCHLGLICSESYPRISGTFPVNYTYSFGQPTAITAGSSPVNLVTSAAYNPAGGLASWVSASSPSVTTTITQDTSLLPRPNKIEAKRGTTVLFSTGAYTYDSAGNILSQADGTYGGTYTYDKGSRLLSATYSGTPRTFAYDGYGNLTQNGAYTMAMNASLNNQVDSVTISGGSPIATAYDPRGNMTGAVGEVIFFDALDRVYRSKNDLVGDYTFLHNGAGERVLKFSSKFTVLRREMARYIAEANIIARGWTLPLCDGSNPSPFTDVPCSDPDARHIKLAFQQSITAGCTGSTFCPDTAINRAQMAVFMVKGYRGASFVPQSCPPAVNPFTDFTCSGPYAAYAPFIIQLYNDHVTGGCGLNTFCPGDPIGEWETLVWLAKGGPPNGSGTIPFWPTYHPVPRGSTYTLRDEGNRVVTEIAGGPLGIEHRLTHRRPGQRVSRRPARRLQRRRLELLGLRSPRLDPRRLERLGDEDRGPPLLALRRRRHGHPQPAPQLPEHGKKRRHPPVLRPRTDTAVQYRTVLEHGSATRHPGKPFVLEPLHIRTQQSCEAYRSRRTRGRQSERPLESNGSILLVGIANLQELLSRTTPAFTRRSERGSDE